jgi:hypothetical protein
MYFNCNLSVTINGLPLSSIISAKTSNDGSKIGGYADIVVPLNSYIQYSNPNDLTTYLTAVRIDQFSSGDPIVITASYDGYPTITMFSGYIFDFVLGMPCTIRCMDYIYFFNLGIFGAGQVTTTNKAGTKIKNTGQGVNYKSISFKSLLQNLIAFVNTNIANLSSSSAQPVTLIGDVFDMTLTNITFISMSPAAILEWFKKELGLNITLYGNQLYVNLASNTNGAVTLRTDVNVIESKLQTVLQKSTKIKGIIKAKTLQSAFERIRLKCWFIQSNGTRTFFEVGDPNGIQEEHFFYKVKNTGTTYSDLAQAALLKAQQHHYRGSLELLLYPQCDLFWRVNYVDKRYPEKNGVYVIQGIYFELSERGFHRKLKVAWLDSTEGVTITQGPTLIE